MSLNPFVAILSSARFGIDYGALLKLAKAQTNWLPAFSDEQGRDVLNVIGKFEACPVNMVDSPPVKAFLSRAGVQPMGGMFLRCYPGQRSTCHKDIRRNTSINFVLSGDGRLDFCQTENGPVVFSHSATPASIVVNVRQWHTVVNTGKEMRYVLTLSYKQYFDQLCDLLA